MPFLENGSPNHKNNGTRPRPDLTNLPVSSFPCFVDLKKLVRTLQR